MNLSNAQLKKLMILLVIGGICLLAWVIFVHHLNLNSMWWDENYTWRTSREGPFSLTIATSKEIHPPGSYLWAWAWMAWTGVSDDLFVIRLSSVIVSILTVAVVYRLGKTWFESDWAGAGAALFLLTTGVFIFYARILRMYALIALLAALSWLVLQRLLDGNSKSSWGYAASVALMAYAHYDTVFVVVAQVVFVLLFYRQHLRKIVLAYGAAFLALVPWIPSFIHQVNVNKAMNNEAAALVAGPLSGKTTSLDTIAKFWSVFSNRQAAFVLLLVVLAILIGLSQATTPGFRRRLTAAIFWFFGTMTAIFAFSLVVPVYDLRYVVTVLPGLALLIGAAVTLLPGSWTRLGVASVIVLTGILGHADVFDDITIIPPYRDLLVTVAKEFQPGDKIWFNLSYGARGSSLELSAAYHLRHDTPRLSTDDFVWNAPHDFDEEGEALRVWDIRPYWIPMPEDAQAVLAIRYTMTEEDNIRGYFIRLYEAPPINQPVYHFGEQFDVMISPLPARIYAPDETVAIHSWWHAQQIVLMDYSKVLLLRNADQQVTSQTDTGLETQGKPTSQWNPQDRYGPVILSLSLPPDISPGKYDLLLGAYYWEDGQRLSISGQDNSQIDSDTGLLRIGSITVE